MNQTESIDVGDYVLHKPTGVVGVASLVEDNKLYWVGYDLNDYAELKDCSLYEKTTEKRRLSLLLALTKTEGTALPIIRARKRLQGDI